MQLSFGWPQASPRWTERLFFAIRPDDTTAGWIERRASRWCAQWGLASSPIAAERLHISLYGLGAHDALPASLVDDACRAAAVVAAEPFDVAFDRCAEFGSGSVVLCGCGLPGVLEFRHRLGLAIAAEPALRHFVTRRAYVPHVTICYRRDARPFHARSIEAIRWTVCDFVLVHSLVGRGRHVRLGQWRLTKRS